MYVVYIYFTSLYFISFNLTFYCEIKGEIKCLVSPGQLAKFSNARSKIID